MSLRKLKLAVEATKEGAATQWRDFTGLDWKWGFGFLAFAPIYAGLYFIAPFIHHAG